MKKLPSQIYVSLEKPGSEDEYLHAAMYSSELAEQAEWKMVGRYVLAETLQISLVVDEKSHKLVKRKP